MNKLSCLLLFLSFAFSHGMAQRKDFLPQVKSELMKPDQLTDILESTVSMSMVDPISFPDASLKKAVLYFLKKNSKNKQFVLQESYHLTRISEITMKKISHASISNGSTGSFERLLRRSQHATLSKFGLIEVYSFEIPLIQAKEGNFYYEKSEGEGTLNLYYNPPKVKKGEPKPAAEPVLLYSEQAILLAIQEKIKRQNIYAALNSGTYYAAGISIQVDQKTLCKKRIPMLRVVISLGSKRLHLVQKKIEKQRRKKAL